MSEKRKLRGPWGQKFFIGVLGVVLGILFYWPLGFAEVRNTPCFCRMYWL